MQRTEGWPPWDSYIPQRPPIKSKSGRSGACSYNKLDSTCMEDADTKMLPNLLVIFTPRHAAIFSPDARDVPFLRKMDLRVENIIPRQSALQDIDSFKRRIYCGKEKTIQSTCRPASGSRPYTSSKRDVRSRIRRHVLLNHLATLSQIPLEAPSPQCVQSFAASL